MLQNDGILEIEMIFRREMGPGIKPSACGSSEKCFTVMQGRIQD